jgi:hypothetical protein
MKVWLREPPKSELQVVRSAEDRYAYSLYLIEARCLGQIKRRGHQQLVITDDGKGFAPSMGTPFQSLVDACLHLLHHHGLEGLEDKLPGLGKKGKQDEEPVKVTGLALIGKSTWVPFAKYRGLNPEDIDAISASYDLTPDEARLFYAIDSSISSSVNG